MAVTLVPPAPPQPPSHAQPPVRIRRAPALEPPADDDRPADDHPICAGQLALFTSVRGAAPRAGHPAARGVSRSPTARGGGRPATPAPATPPGRTTPARAAPSARTAPPERRTPERRTPPAQVAAGRFVSACVEVLNGFRPVAHLRALTRPVEFAAVATQLTRRTARVRLPEGARAGQERVRLRRLQVFEQPTGVAEAVAVLRHGETAWAMALRFEHHRDSWLCTLLEVI